MKKVEISAKVTEAIYDNLIKIEATPLTQESKDDRRLDFSIRYTSKEELEDVILKALKDN